MRRYDDRYGGTRLYVGHLSSRTRSRGLERIFSRYGRFLGILPDLEVNGEREAMMELVESLAEFRLEGRCMMHFQFLSNDDGLIVCGNRFRRVRDVDMKHDFAFVDFSDPRDADDARYSLNGREFDGSRLIVEFAKGAPHGPGGSRDSLGRGPPPGSGRCFNCGLDGHWARDCKAGDWKNKCYRCGERGHIERNCQNSPKKLRRGRSYSRSPVRSRSPRRGRGRSRSQSYSRSRSYSRSGSPRNRDYSVERETRRSRSPSYSRSPKPQDSPPPSKERKCSPTPGDDEGSPMEEKRSPSPKISVAAVQDGSEYSESPPRGKNTSTVGPENNSSVAKGPESPSEANGRSPSPNPRDDDRSPVDEDDDNNRFSRGSESP